MDGPAENKTMSKWAVLCTVMLAIFMSVLDGSIVNIALPEMMNVFRTGTDRVRMVVELYAIAFAVSTLTASWLRYRFGIKRTFIGGLLLFTAASWLCGHAWDINSMVAFRIIQGLGGGIMLPAGTTLVTESFPPQERGKAFGIFGIVIVFAPTIGPMLGGYFVDYLDWRYIFLINIPIGAVNFLVANLVLRKMKAPRPPSRFDFIGFTSLSAAISCMLLGLSHGQRAGWGSPYIISQFAVSVVSVIVFFISSMKNSQPLINLSLFRNRRFAIISLLNLMRSVALFARLFLVPLFFQSVAGFSAVTTGFIVTAGAVFAGITTPLTGFLVDRIGPLFFFFAGFIVMGLSNVTYATIQVDSSQFAIYFPMVLFGIGSGLLNTPIMSGSMNAVQRQDIGQVSTLLTVLLQVGSAFGVALFGTVVNMRISAVGDAVSGFQDGFLYLGIFSFLALIPALGLIGTRPVAESAD